MRRVLQQLQATALRTPVLRQRCIDVPLLAIQSPHIQAVCQRLRSQCQKQQLIGLAAPQIGEPLRIIAMRRTVPPQIKREIDLFSIGSSSDSESEADNASEYKSGASSDSLSSPQFTDSKASNCAADTSASRDSHSVDKRPASIDTRPQFDAHIKPNHDQNQVNQSLVDTDNESQNKQSNKLASETDSDNETLVVESAARSRLYDLSIDPQILINPVLSNHSSNHSAAFEGCSSIVGYCGAVQRCRRVSVEFTTPQGESQTLDLIDADARTVQHEVDHLDGRLFIDYVNEDPESKLISQQQLAVQKCVSYEELDRMQAKDEYRAHNEQIQAQIEMREHNARLEANRKRIAQEMEQAALAMEQSKQAQQIKQQEAQQKAQEAMEKQRLDQAKKLAESKVKSIKRAQLKAASKARRMQQMQPNQQKQQ